MHRTIRIGMLMLALVLYGNAKSWWDLVVLGTSAAGSTFGIGAGIALVLAILVLALVMRVEPAALGLAGGSWRRSLRLGWLVGGSAAIVGAALIVGGALVGRALGVPLESLTPGALVPWDQLLWRAVLLLWVDTVIPEELGFRGALFLALGGGRDTPSTTEVGSPRRLWVGLARAATRPAVLVSSVAFAAWHLVVVSHESAADPLMTGAKLGVILLGGLLFGGLRVLGGNLLAPVVGHWLFDLAAMVAARAVVGRY